MKIPFLYCHRRCMPSQPLRNQSIPHASGSPFNYTVMVFYYSLYIFFKSHQFHDITLFLLSSIQIQLYYKHITTNQNPDRYPIRTTYYIRSENLTNNMCFIGLHALHIFYFYKHHTIYGIRHHYISIRIIGIICLRDGMNGKYYEGT